MNKLLRASLILAAVMMFIIHSESAEASSEDDRITTQVPNGIWINETLNISGSTTITPQNANWVIYNVTNPYVEWDVIANGDYFSSVVPVSEGIWIWNLEVNLTGIECTCWLEINQPYGMQKEILNRVIFVGNGPHEPIISRNHDLNIFIDEDIEISGEATLSRGNVQNSQMKIQWCYSPQGACNGTLSESNVDVDWDGLTYTFNINASELNLFDGKWNLTYFLQDEYLMNSPIIFTTLSVDQTDPVAVLIAQENASEGDVVLIDGSGSRDGIWGDNLQTLWYITNPNGSISVIDGTSTQKLTHQFIPLYPGNYTIRLDVFDAVGRTSSTSVDISVNNVPPDFEFRIDGLNSSENSKWRVYTNDKIELSAIVFDSQTDINSMSYRWYLENELISEESNFNLSLSKMGSYILKLEIEDNDGEIVVHDLQIIVEPKEQTEKAYTFEVIFVIFVISLVGVIRFVRSKNRKIKTIDLPKWNDNN